MASALLVVSFNLEAAADQPATSRKIDLTVTDVTGLDLHRPVTGGVPLAEGAAMADSRFLLTNDQGEQVPCQASIMARWNDGSARWVLLDFQSAPPANGTARYALSWSEPLEPLAPRQPVRSPEQPKNTLQSGSIQLRPATEGLLDIGDRLSIRMTLIDNQGRRCVASAQSSELETVGPLRGTMFLRGTFHRPDGSRMLGFQLRASLFAGSSAVRLEPHLLVDPEAGVVQQIRGLTLEIVPRSLVRSISLNGRSLKPAGRLVRLLQLDDENWRFEGVQGTGSKAPGWAELTDTQGTVAVAVRDFWQQWPKSLEADDRSLILGLLPEFSAGTFDHMGPWYKHQYLFNGNCYRLRTGQSRRWQIWLNLSGKGDSLVHCANSPLVPAADPNQAIATGVWGPIEPAGTSQTKAYDQWAENLFVNGYLNSIAVQRDYGALNWGDWWGERGCNWGNHEYDTPKHMLLQFARTGDPNYFYAGDTAARHTSEIDVIQFVNDDLRRYFEETLGGNAHYPVRPGMVHEHCVGHVSGVYSVDRIRKLYVSLGIGKSEHPYLCLDPYNLGHIWTQGMVADYFLTGDPWMKQTVEKIGRNLAQLVEEREFPFKGGSHSGRVNGWTMLAIAGAYELDFDERYLKAMKLLADDALSEQDPQTGGWRYQLPWGHCFCDKKHWGEAAFIGAIRLNGLSKYYQLTGDPRIPEAVRRGVDHMNRDTWEEKHSGWRYTSCPKSSSGPGHQMGVIVMALVNSVAMTGDAEQLRILRKAWKAKFEKLLVAPTSKPGLGKTYSSIMVSCPEAMHLFINNPTPVHSSPVPSSPANRAQTNTAEGERPRLEISELKKLRKQAANRQRRIVYNDDGNHVKPYATPEELISLRVQQVVDTQVDTISYCTGGGGLFWGHQPEVGEVLGEFVTDTSSIGVRQIRDSLIALKNLETDPLEVVVEHSHQNNMELFWSYRMNNPECSFAPAYLSKRRRNNPKYIMGVLADFKKYPHSNPKAWYTLSDFEQADVRDHIVRIFEDVCQRYDIDGIELDFIRHPLFFRPNLEGQPVEPRHVAMMTDLVRRIRAVSDRESITRDRPILITARVPLSVKSCLSIGIDIGAYLEEDLIDIMIAGQDYIQMAVASSLKEMVDLGHRHQVPVYALLVPPKPYERYRHDDRAWRAAAMNRWHWGADGIYLFNLFPSKPDERFSQLGSAESLRGRDKIYAIDNPAQEAVLGTFKQVMVGPNRLPITLTPGENAIAKLPVGEDIRANTPAGKTVSTLLRLQLDGLVQGDKIQVVFNGNPLVVTESIEPLGPTPSSAWYHIQTNPEWVEAGYNRIGVLLDSKRNVTTPVSVDGLDLVVSYGTND